MQIGEIGRGGGRPENWLDRTTINSKAMADRMRDCGCGEVLVGLVGLGGKSYDM